MDLPIKKNAIFHSCVSLPEGKFIQLWNMDTLCVMPRDIFELSISGWACLTSQPTLRPIAGNWKIPVLKNESIELLVSFYWYLLWIKVNESISIECRSRLRNPMISARWIHLFRYKHVVFLRQTAMGTSQHFPQKYRAWSRDWSCSVNHWSWFQETYLGLYENGMSICVG